MKGIQMMNKDQLIAKLRKVQGEKSMDDFAYSIGISESMLSRIYSGSRNPGQKILDLMNLDAIRTITTVYVERKKK